MTRAFRLTVVFTGLLAHVIGCGTTDPSFVAAADLYGDSKPDLAVANYESETVSVLLNACLP